MLPYSRLYALVGLTQDAEKAEEVDFSRVQERTNTFDLVARVATNMFEYKCKRENMHVKVRNGDS